MQVQIWRDLGHLPSPAALPALGSSPADGTPNEEGEDLYLHGWLAHGPERYAITDTASPTTDNAGVGGLGRTIAGIETGVAAETSTNLYYASAQADPARPRPKLVYFPQDYTTTYGGAVAPATYEAGVESVVAAVGPGTTSGVVYFEGLNEPDETGLTAAQAAGLFNQFRTGVRAGSTSAKAVGPAISAAAPDGSSFSPQLSWLATFLADVVSGGGAVDGISVHNYNGWTADPLVAEGWLSELHATLVSAGISSDPVWCTELGNIIKNFWNGTTGIFITDRRLVAATATSYLAAERNGVPKEQLVYFYDTYQGGQEVYTCLKSQDGSLGPQATFFRVYSEELWGKAWSRSLTFGTTGDLLYRADVFSEGSSGSGTGACVVLYAPGMVGDTVTLTGVGSSSVTVSDWLGNTTAYVPAGGSITVPISDLPTYVRIPLSAAGSVAVTGGVASATDLALSATAKAGSNPAALSAALSLNNGVLDTGGFLGSDTFYQSTTFPQYVELDWLTAQTLNHVVIRQAAPYMDWPSNASPASAMLTGQLEYWNGSAWVGCPTNGQNHWDGAGNYDNTTADDFFSTIGHDNAGSDGMVFSQWDQNWVLHVPLSSSISTTKIRLTITTVSAGNFATNATNSVPGMAATVSELMALYVPEMTVATQPTGAYIIDGGSAGTKPVGTAPVDLVSTWVRSPLDMNSTDGTGWLLNSTTRDQASALYELGMQIAVLVDMSKYPLYALTPQFQNDLVALVTNVAGSGPEYGALLLVLHDSIEEYNSSSTQAYLTAPLVSGASAYWDPAGAANTVTLSYQSSGGDAPAGTPVLQNGDNVYFDETVGITGLAASPGGTTPNCMTTIAAGSNGVNVTTLTGTQTLDVTNVPAVLPSSGTVVLVSGSNTMTGTIVISYTGTAAGQLLNCSLVSGNGTLATGWIVWPGSEAPVPTDLTGPYVVSGVSTTGGVTTFTAATGTTPVVVLNPNSFQPGATPVFGGLLKTDSTTAVAHAGYASNAAYQAAIVATFSSIQSAVKAAYYQTTVGLGLTGMNWTGSSISLTTWAAALAAADFIGVNLAFPYTEVATATQALGWAFAQLHSSYPTTPLMVSWFDLYDPVSPILHNAAHYTNVTTAFDAFLAGFVTTNVTLTNGASPTSLGVTGTVPPLYSGAQLTVTDGLGTVQVFTTSGPYAGGTGSQTIPIVATPVTLATGSGYTVLGAFGTGVFNDTVMRTLTNEGLFAWNWFNDDYLNTISWYNDSYTAVEYGLSYNDLVAATDRYALPQHFFNTNTLAATARIQATPTNGLGATARIIAGASNSIGATASIRVGNAATITATASIGALVTSAISATGRIMAASANGIPATASIQATATNTIGATAEIVIYQSNTIAATARIATTPTGTMSATARITTAPANTLAATAVIAPPAIPPGESFVAVRRNTTFTAVFP